MLIAGISERYNESTRGGIPGQWQRFVPHLGHVPAQLGADAYGVCYNTDDEANMDYLCGVEVANFSALPPELTRLRVPPQRYAVFHHRDPLHPAAAVPRPPWRHRGFRLPCPTGGGTEPGRPGGG